MKAIGFGIIVFLFMFILSAMLFGTDFDKNTQDEKDAVVFGVLSFSSLMAIATILITW